VRGVPREEHATAEAGAVTREDELTALLVAVGAALQPEATKERVGRGVMKKKERTWQSGLCWSFAEGVRRWIGDEASLVAAWIEDVEYESYPIHVLCRAPSGLLLDSRGAHDASVAQEQENAFYDGVLGPERDTREPWIEKVNAFELRAKGIFPPRERLVRLVAGALADAGPAKKYGC